MKGISEYKAESLVGDKKEKNSKARSYWYFQNRWLLGLRERGWVCSQSGRSRSAFLHTSIHGPVSGGKAFCKTGLLLA